MDSLETTEIMADFVTCAYPLSGMYSATARYTYYTGILLLLIGPAKPWVAIAPATNAIIYSSTAALHSIIMASQPRSRSAPFDVDALYAIMINILGIGPALYISLLPDAIVLRWIRILTFSWSIWLFIGMLSAIFAVARPLPVFEPCTAVNSGVILAQPRDLDLANFTCVYPCFEPSLASDIRIALEVTAIQSFNLSSVFDEEAYERTFMGVVFLAFPALYVSLSVSLYSTYLHLNKKSKSGMGFAYTSVPLALILILSTLILELKLRIRNFPQGESFRNADQWSVLINTVMVISGAIYTGWKPRIRIPGMPFASYWHVVDPIEELKLRGSMLSDMAPGPNRGLIIDQNDAEALIGRFPGGRLSKGIHPCSFEQAQLNTEASEMMPYTNVTPAFNQGEFIAAVLSESGFL